MADLALGFEAIVEGWSLPVMVLDRDLKFVFCNQSYLSSVHRERDELIGQYVFDAFPDTPERVADVESRFRAALSGETTYLDAYEYELRDPNGSVSQRIWQGVQEPVRDKAGEVQYMLQRVEDITDQELLRRENDVISQELDHRVKNLMTIIQAIAYITSKRAETVEAYTKDFLSRMTAMSRTYDRLSVGNWSGLTMKSLFEDELAPYMRSGEIVTLDGIDFKLSVKSTKDASLIIHELATNAAKYGCFSTPEGRLHVSWKIEDGYMTTTWTETGLTGITEPEEQGFGSKLFDMMPNLKVSRDYRDEGLQLELVVPVSIAVNAVEFT